jgi:hypothetical protein
MPTAKTECTELSVGFGLLGIEPGGLSATQIAYLFSGSLPYEKYTSYMQEYHSNPYLYARFINVGLQLRNSYPLFANLSQITWSGPQQQAATTSASKDLFAANVPVSIKNESNVVLNPSPYNLFVTIPSGSMPASQAQNWYEHTDSQEIQNLYSFVRNHANLHLPVVYSEFEQKASKTDRIALQTSIRNFQGNDKAEFSRLYTQMCRTVASISADDFNQNLQNTMSTNIRSSVLENIIKQFFRVNAVPYILTGVDDRRSFALRIPDITEWKQNWRFISLVATPDLTRGQSVVDLCMTLEQKDSRQIHELPFHVEIRWSHGKFCGNPEAKLYKEFIWSSVPFFTNVLG